jgi:hypothetical protein
MLQVEMHLMMLIIFLIIHSYLVLILCNLLVSFSIYLTIMLIQTNLLEMNTCLYDEQVFCLIISIILLERYLYFT